MEAKFWHERWKLNQIGFHLEEVNPYLIEHFHLIRPAQGTTVFMPLCGKSLDMVWLKGQGQAVLGVELSEVAALDFFRENALEFEQFDDPLRVCAEGIEIRIDDFFNLKHTDLQQVGAVYDRASLIALPPAMRVRYAQHFKMIVPASAPVLLITLEYAQEEMKGPPFSVPESEVKLLYADRFDVQVVDRHDVLAAHDHFRRKGLNALRETIYLMRR
jgi:thiopurine S-methyltransferase